MDATMQIKGSIVFAFVVWMQQGQHDLTERKGNIIMRKSGKTAQIYWNKGDYFDINDYCQERYLIFLNQWLKGGIDFIDDLKEKGVMQVNKLRSKSYMELMK